MINEQFLSDLIDVFNQPGNTTPYGLAESEVEAMLATLVVEQEQAIEKKPVCVVKHWTIWQMAEDHKLFLLKADYVISHTWGLRQQGDWVRTSPLINFREQCIFETKNTIYLMVGPGTIKTVSANDALQFF